MTFACTDCGAINQVLEEESETPDGIMHAYVRARDCLCGREFREDDVLEADWVSDDYDKESATPP